MDSESKGSAIFHSVAALKYKNFRAFWLGQAVSLIGLWMQVVAQSWLVLEITKSAFWLGVVTAVQFLPLLLFSLHAGVLADRFSKKKILLFTQSAMAVLALLLFLELSLNAVKLWHIIVMAGILGILDVIDMPTRQAFVGELVEKKAMTNAILLNSLNFNTSRIIGPSIAGAVIAFWGIKFCFLLNGLSFIPVILGILSIKPIEHEKILEHRNIWNEIGAGIDFVRNTKEILIPLLIITLVDIFAVNYNVMIPLYAKNVLMGKAQDYGYLMSAFSVGAFIAVILLMIKSAHGPKFRNLLFGVFGLCFVELMLVPVKAYVLAVLLFGAVGFVMALIYGVANPLVQTQTPEHLRGRVMSIYILVTWGATPVASFIAGSTSDLWGAPKALAVGAIISLVLVTSVLLRYPHFAKLKKS